MIRLIGYPAVLISAGLAMATVLTAHDTTSGKLGGVTMIVFFGFILIGMVEMAHKDFGGDE